ncbi:hypothetical protein FJT64_001208 [Amphibalanus amphitrite]|uniref:Reverse transcriptase domain-containing protein n=1 Tax=Amphibalanus amphitrite TaxID=1232801 RepID=A0A6A4V774_AMPAM|nr:hypothetical protein FJT64_001208 [Amphibalanus amphitrite]
MTEKLNVEQFQEYDDHLHQLLEDAVIEPALPSPPSEFILPHRGLHRNGKLRVVFDGSAPDGAGMSLNSYLEPGENLLHRLPAVLLNFRSGAVGCQTDIRAAFHQIVLTEEDRQFVQLLWAGQRLRFRRVPFGLTCSPYMLLCTIAEHVRRCLRDEPVLLQKVQDSVYMDDMCPSFSTRAEAEAGLTKMGDVFSEASMDLHKTRMSGDDTEDEKVLGLLWSTRSDRLAVTVPQVTCPGTRTELLSAQAVNRTAWILRFAHNARHQRTERRSGALSPEERREALRFWIRVSQSAAYAPELEALTAGAPLPPNSRLEKDGAQPSVQPGDDDVLTPAHLLFGVTSIRGVLSPSGHELDSLSRRWRHQRLVSEHLVQRWTKEYLQTLRTWSFSRRGRPVRLPEVGEIVLVHAEERGSDKLVWGEGETIQDYLRRVDAYALLGDEKKTIGKTLLGLGHRISVIDSLSDTDKSSVTNLKAALLREFGDTTQQSQRQFLTRRKRDGHRLPLEARASGAPVHSVQVRLGHDCLLEPHSERVVEELKAAHATVVEREERTKRRRQELSSRNAHVARYKKGDLVFQRCPPKPGRPGKLQPRWDGPYIVVECRQGNVYLIKKADNFRRRYVRHHDRLKPFEDRGERLGAPPPPPAGSAPAGEEREDGQRDPSDESSDSSPSLDEERTELSSSASDESDEEAEAASGVPPPRRGSRQRKPASRWPEGQWTQ